ncbi:MAG: discoidin domain-containing protein [Anaerolineales bacterium]|nr:discoidin domain-containing protein [Anaerolineales bacterium]
MLSHNQPTAASSTLGGGFGPGQAVDGNWGTPWVSQIPSGGIDWLYVDLGGNSAITQVVIVWGIGYAQAFQIEVSDNATDWTSVYSTSGEQGGNDTISLFASGRYLRVYNTQLTAVNYYSIRELEIYGSIP